MRSMLLSCTTMPNPNKELINITFIQTDGKYKCLCYTSPQYNENNLSGKFIKIKYVA